MNFEQAFVRLLGEEGGYANRRRTDDPGGKTMWGVTEAVARAAGYLGDMQGLPQETAKHIYQASYWDPLKIDKLPEELRYSVFDASVNNGQKQAARWLQRAIGVTDDGTIGPITLAATQALPVWQIVAKFNGQRLMMMSALANWPGNSRGWAKRIAANLLEG